MTGRRIGEIFPDRSESAFRPRASVLFAPVARVSFHASAYRAFRAPTLNELYRDFRVGSVLTQANEHLRAERLTGGEAGANFSTRDRKLAARATVFVLRVTGPVANVTLTDTPALIRPRIFSARATKWGGRRSPRSGRRCCSESA